MSHTPSPWKIEAELDQCNLIRYMLASTMGGESNEEAIANARLMEAAPDILAAGKALMLRLDRACAEGRINATFLDHERLVLRKALARAERRKS